MSEINSLSNSILRAIPADQRDEILSKFELVPLVFGEHLHSAGDLIRNVYLPESGVISLVSSADDISYIEVGMIGCEGLAGFPVVLGAKTSVATTFIQVDGEAYRISADEFLEVNSSVETLRRATLRFIHGLMTQTSLAAACNAFHPADKRLARWLLMTRDRVTADEFPVTQEFLSMMLGVRREAVNRYVGELRRMGYIDSTRGKITIIDRQALENMTCSCYREINAAYIDDTPN